jgi:predicted ABC-type ATPase
LKIQCTILAGLNGSGKSTIYDAIEPIPSGEFLNPDIVARHINPDNPGSPATSRAAGKHVLQTIKNKISNKQEFVFETTLSGNQPLKLISQAKSAGYQIQMVFAFLSNVKLNIERVADRVAAGGHNIPEDVIRRRFSRTFDNFGKVIELCDHVEAFDNSKEEPELVLQIKAGEVTFACFDPEIETHKLIQDACESHLGASLENSFQDPEETSLDSPSP